MSDDDMVAEALRQAQDLDDQAEAFAAASPEPSVPADPAPAEGATMAMSVSEMFDDEE
jgi:hypothetical protein